jgi:hypothetical protein
MRLAWVQLQLHVAQGGDGAEGLAHAAEG